MGAKVIWLPFDLHPEYPPAGLPREQLIARYGPEMTERMREFFAARGLDYNPHPDVVPNSMRAQQLTELARDLDRHEATHDRIMDAYWSEAQDIGDIDVLRALAAELELPADDVEEVLTARSLPRPHRRIDTAGRVGRRQCGARIRARPPPARARRPAERGLRAGLRAAGSRVRVVDEIAEATGWMEEERMRRTSHALAVDGRVWLFDAVDWPGLEERVRALGEPAGVIQLLDRHNRDCAAVAQRLGVPHHVVPGSLPGTPFEFLPVCGSAGGRRSRSGGRSAGSSSSPTCSGRSPSSARATSPPGSTRSCGSGRHARCAGLAPEHLLVGHGEGIHGEHRGGRRERVANGAGGASRAARRDPARVVARR